WLRRVLVRRRGLREVVGGRRHDPVLHRAERFDRNEAPRVRFLPELEPNMNGRLGRVADDLSRLHELETARPLEHRLHEHLVEVRVVTRARAVVDADREALRSLAGEADLAVMCRVDRNEQRRTEIVIAVADVEAAALVFADGYCDRIATRKPR